MRPGLACLVTAAALGSVLPDGAGARPSDVDRAAAKADQGVRAVVKRLAGASLGGRDNDTPESDRAQALLIRKLRRMGEGLNTAASGDDAYRQPFVQNGQAGTNLV